MRGIKIPLVAVGGRLSLEGWRLVTCWGRSGHWLLSKPSSHVHEAPVFVDFGTYYQKGTAHVIQHGRENLQIPPVKYKDVCFNLLQIPLLRGLVCSNFAKNKEQP